MKENQKKTIFQQAKDTLACGGQERRRGEEKGPFYYFTNMKGHAPVSDQWKPLAHDCACSAS